MVKASGPVSDPPPVVHPFRRGEVIAGKYRLRRSIGEGAMGTVWVAHNDMLDIDVAIKLMRIDNPRSNPTDLYQRLLQEARAAARLGHPAIVRVFDFGRTEDGTPYIVMELLRGEPLSELMGREGRLDVTRAVQMMLPMADALATAHGRGIVHRDIKPENIFISTDEYGRLQPKLVDFGVARFAEGGRTLTRSGALMGTPDYMAPEQARGDPDVDHRADVWALCVVLYELMVGARPFGVPDANYLAVLRAIVHDRVKPMTDFGIGDAGLWLIIERGLRKKPQERWDTMRVLGEALALWLYERGIREDAYGASLKTTWLQSGIDGVKIDTPSMSPPADELEPAIPDAERTTLPAPDEVSSDAAPAAVIVPAPSGAAAQQVLVVRRPLWQYFAGAMTVTVLLSATISLIVGRLVTSRDERADGVSEALPQPSVASQTLPTSAPVPSEAVPPPSATALEVSPQAEDGANIPSTPATDAGASKAKTRRRTAPAHPTQRGKLPPPGTFDFGF